MSLEVALAIACGLFLAGFGVLFLFGILGKRPPPPDAEQTIQIRRGDLRR